MTRYPHDPVKKIWEKLTTFLSWKEVVESSLILKLLYYVFIFNSIFYFYTFDKDSVCWPHFQTCKNFIHFQGLPLSYDLHYFLIICFGLLIYGSYLFYRRYYNLGLILLLIIFIIRVYFTFFGDYNSGNFNYYDVYLLFIYLFLPKKELFLKITFVFFYFLSSSIKLDESFILAKYFTSLQLGAPIFDKNWVIFFSNLVIIMQMIGSWFLFSKNKTLRTAVYAYFTVFHLYSGLLVGYRYIITSIPFLLILFNDNFGNNKNYDVRKELKYDRYKNIPGFIFMFFLLFSQTIPYLIPGNHKQTLEGNNYGFYMFEANYQCISEIKNRGKVIKNHLSNDARNRCDPYTILQKNKYLCLQYDELSWRVKSSVNGGPFFVIVDVPNLCDLSYAPFIKNKWISDTKENISGYPYQNYYYHNFIDKNKFISERQIIVNTKIQTWLEKIIFYLSSLYKITFIFTLLVLLLFILKSIKKGEP